MESANIWHRRVGHINGKYLDVLRRVSGNGIEFTSDLQPRGVCAKSSQQPHPKSAKNDVTLPFQLVTVDVLGELRPGAMGGFKFFSNISDQLTE